MKREKSKWRTHKDESTDAGRRDGRARRSEEDLQARVSGAGEQVAIHVGQSAQTARADGVDYEEESHPARLVIEVRPQLTRLIVEDLVRGGTSAEGRSLRTACEEKSGGESRQLQQPHRFGAYHEVTPTIPRTATSAVAPQTSQRNGRRRSPCSHSPVAQAVCGR